MNSTVSIIQDAVSPPMNVENHHTNHDNDSTNAAVMITVGILAVVFLWIVIIGCYYYPKNKGQDKDSTQILTKYKRTQSTTLLIQPKQIINNDKAFTFVEGIHFILFVI